MSNVTIVLSADDKSAAALVSAIKASVNSGAKYAAYVEAHSVTRETVADHARALAVLAYPNAKPVQTVMVDGVKVRTTFGNAVQAAGAGLRKALGPVPSTPSLALLTTLGKSATREQVIAAWEAAQS